MLSQHQDLIETITDDRVGLILNGHTHGSLVVLPVVGTPSVPTRFGQTYLSGLVKTPSTQVFVTRGLGAVTPPVRFCCPQEVVLITIS